MSIEKVGTLLNWSKNGYGIITIPIPGSRNVERYYLSHIRILAGPPIPKAGMKIRFNVITAVPNSGQLPAACNAVFIEDDISDNAVKIDDPLADLLSGPHAAVKP